MGNICVKSLTITNGDLPLLPSLSFIFYVDMLSHSWRSGRAGGRSRNRHISQDILAQTTVLRHSDDLRSSFVNKGQMPYHWPLAKLRPVAFSCYDIAGFLSSRKAKVFFPTIAIPQPIKRYLAQYYC